MLYKLATIGLLSAELHAGYKAGLVFEHTANGVLHQLLSILAVGGGHLLEARFYIRREMYFHAPKGRVTNSQCQPRKSILNVTIGTNDGELEHL